MQTTIFILLIVIALLICAIAGLVIVIYDKNKKLITSYNSNKEVYKWYKQIQEVLGKKQFEINTLHAQIKRLQAKNKPLEPVYDTGDYKKEILRDYKNGCTVDYIAKKYWFKVNTIYKAISRWRKQDLKAKKKK